MTAPASPRALPLRRGHLADDVFAVLAAEILQGTLVPGTALPPERALSERFGVSKLLVRQAVHRLAEASLVEVRQGGTTRVLDPAEATDLRMFELLYRLAPESGATRQLARDVLEKQFTQGLSLLDSFSRRAPPGAHEGLRVLVEQARPDRHDDAKMRRMEEQFWIVVAEACGNRILRAEVRWWYRALRTRPDHPKPPSPEERWRFYLGLVNHLDNEHGAVTYYLNTLSPAIDELFFEPEPKQTRKKGAR